MFTPTPTDVFFNNIKEDIEDQNKKYIERKAEKQKEELFYDELLKSFDSLSKEYRKKLHSIKLDMLVFPQKDQGVTLRFGYLDGSSYSLVVNSKNKTRPMEVYSYMTIKNEDKEPEPEDISYKPERDPKSFANFIIQKFIINYVNKLEFHGSLPRNS